MHSSFEELKQFVSKIKSKKFIPITNYDLKCWKEIKKQAKSLSFETEENFYSPAKNNLNNLKIDEETKKKRKRELLEKSLSDVKEGNLLDILF